MTRKQMITKCVEAQIVNGVVKEENKDLQIKARLNGRGLVKAMNKSECEKWYKECFEA